MPKLLSFVAKTDPILREILPDWQDFNAVELHATIEDMRYSILPEQLKAAHGAHHNAAGMAANQWGIRMRLFVFTPEGSEAGALCDIMINPSYTPYLRPNETEYALVAAMEGCFSIPLTLGLINRYDAIWASYYNPAGDKIECLMEGWHARVFQHETDHLNGKLFDGTKDNYPGPECLSRLVFKNEDELNHFRETELR